MATPSRNDLNYKVVCPDCRSPHPNLVEDFASGDLICRDCGCVVGDRIIDTRSEWRTFSNESGGDDPSRVGGPANPLLDGDQLDTLIGKKDGTSKDLSKLQSRSALKASDKNLLSAFQTISIMSERIGLPKIIADRAKQIFKKVDNEKVLKGKSQEGIIAACIYIACRQEKVPRTFREISALTLLPKKEIGRCYKAVAPFLESGIEAVSTEDFLSRYCSYLDLGIEVQKAAASVIRKATELGILAGKSPISIAAAGIYMITLLFPQFSRATKDISFVAGVSETTIKHTYKELYARRHELIPREIATGPMIDKLPCN